MRTFSAYLRRSSDKFATFRNSSFFFSPRRNIVYVDLPIIPFVHCYLSFRSHYGQQKCLELLTSWYLKKTTEKNETATLITHVNLLMRNNQQICDNI